MGARLRENAIKLTTTKDERVELRSKLVERLRPTTAEIAAYKESLGLAVASSFEKVTKKALTLVVAKLEAASQSKSKRSWELDSFNDAYDTEESPYTTTDAGALSHAMVAIRQEKGFQKKESTSSTITTFTWPIGSYASLIDKVATLILDKEIKRWNRKATEIADSILSKFAKEEGKTSTRSAMIEANAQHLCPVLAKGEKLDQLLYGSFNWGRYSTDLHIPKTARSKESDNAGHFSGGVIALIAERLTLAGDLDVKLQFEKRVSCDREQDDQFHDNCREHACLTVKW